LREMREEWESKNKKKPVQHKSLIGQKATECRSYDQPKIRRNPVFGQFALSRSSTDFRLVVRPTFGSLLTDYFFVLYGKRDRERKIEIGKREESFTMFLIDDFFGVNQRISGNLREKNWESLPNSLFSPPLNFQRTVHRAKLNPTHVFKIQQIFHTKKRDIQIKHRSLSVFYSIYQKYINFLLNLFAPFAFIYFLPESSFGQM
jgi:hypothetical protein